LKSYVGPVLALLPYLSYFLKKIGQVAIMILRSLLAPAVWLYRKHQQLSEDHQMLLVRGFAAIGMPPDTWLYTWPGAVAPLKSLADSADGVGLLAGAPERDGVVRRLPMLARIGDTLYPSLVLETLRTVAGDPSYQIKTR